MRPIFICIPHLAKGARKDLKLYRSFIHWVTAAIYLCLFGATFGIADYYTRLNGGLSPIMHRHRYYGVFAPNSPMRAAVTALAPMPVVAPLLVVATETETDSPPCRAASHYLWAMLLARIYETLPLVCPNCQSPMRIIAFITDAGTVRKILDHLGESAQPPRIAPARGPPLWEAAAALEHAGNDSEWDVSAQPAPEFEFDQRNAW